VLTLDIATQITSILSRRTVPLHTVNVSQLHVVVKQRYASAELRKGSGRCAQHCDNWLVALRLPARWWQDAATLLPQQFRTGNLLSRTCRLLHTAALFSLEHFCPLVRWCICELHLRIPVQFMPLGLHKHLHIQALFYPTIVTSYFPSARSPYKLRHTMNVFVKCNAILRAEGKQFQRLLWTRRIQEQHNCNILNQNVCILTNGNVNSGRCETVWVKQCELSNKIMSMCNERAVLINTACGVHSKDRNCISGIWQTACSTEGKRGGISILRNVGRYVPTIWRHSHSPGNHNVKLRRLFKAKQYNGKLLEWAAVTPGVRTRRLLKQTPATPQFVPH
jgi:hypothetical protein